MIFRHNVKICIIDDDKLVRDSMAKILRYYGYEVVTSEAPKPCEKCRCSENECCADLILCDYNMPEMNGINFIKKQKKAGCRAQKIALISGNLQHKVVQEAKALACDVFYKPISVGTLNRWVEHAERNIPPSRKLHSFYWESEE